MEQIVAETEKEGSMPVEVFHRMGTETLQSGYYDVYRGRHGAGSPGRWLWMVAGGALAAYGLKRRGSVGGAAAVTGAMFLYSGATGRRDISSALGFNRMRRWSADPADVQSTTRRDLGGSRGIHVEQSVTINRPVGEVYRFWR